MGGKRIDLIEPLSDVTHDRFVLHRKPRSMLVLCATKPGLTVPLVVKRPFPPTATTSAPIVLAASRRSHYGASWVRSLTRTGTLTGRYRNTIRSKGAPASAPEFGVTKA